MLDLPNNAEIKNLFCIIILLFCSCSSNVEPDPKNSPTNENSSGEFFYSFVDNPLSTYKTNSSGRHFNEILKLFHNSTIAKVDSALQLYKLSVAEKDSMDYLEYLLLHMEYSVIVYDPENILSLRQLIQNILSKEDTSRGGLIAKLLWAEYHLMTATKSNRANLDSVFKILHPSRNAIRKMAGLHPRYIFKFYYDLGEYYVAKGDYGNAEQHFDSALISYPDKSLIGRDKLFYPILLEIANVSNFLKKPNKALEFVQLAEKAIEEGNIEKEEYGRLFFIKAMAEGTRYNFEKALNYYEQADFWYKKKPGNGLILARIAHNRGNIYYMMNKFKEAQSEYLLSIRSLDTITPTQSLSIANAYSNLAFTQLLMGMTDSAMRNANMAINLLKPNQKASYLIRPYYILGQAYQDLSPDLSYKNYQKALQLSYQSPGTPLYRIGHIYHKLGEFYLSQKNLHKALELTHRSIGCYVTTLDTNNYEKTPILSGQELNNPGDLFETLILRARILNKIGVQKNDTVSSRRSLDTYILAQQLIDTMRVNIEAEGDKLIVLEKTYKLYEPAISVAYRLYQNTGQKKYIRKAFNLAEKSKANILLEAVHNREALQFAGIEKNVQLLELQWKEELNYLKRRLRETGNLSETDNVRRNLVDRQFFLQKRYDSLMIDFALHHPSYYRFKNDFNVVDIPTLQQSLEADQAVVEYAYGDSSLYAWIIQANRDTMIHIPKNTALETQIEDYIRSISARARQELVDSLTYYDAVYAKSAFTLYRKLILPLGKLPYRVTLIPDGMLSRIAFDALISRQVDHSDYLSYPFFMNDHALSSCFSATMLREMQEKRVYPERKKVLALALSFPAHDAKVQGREQQTYYWNRLDASYQKTKRINNLIKANTLLETEASIDNFKSKAPKYSVLLFSTHCVLDNGSGENSFLALADSSYPSTISPLYPSDLYNISLNAELVILSACLTAGGKHQKGEGILSLARGFSYAGAKSILATLWEVNDGVNAIFLDYFYQEIQNESRSKDVALKLARKKYLDNIPDREKAHPYYWAAATAIGDMRPLERTSRLLSYQYLWVFCIFALPMFLLWAIRSRLSYPNPQRML